MKGTTMTTIRRRHAPRQTLGVQDPRAQEVEAPRQRRRRLEARNLQAALRDRLANQRGLLVDHGLIHRQVLMNHRLSVKSIQA